MLVMQWRFIVFFHLFPKTRGDCFSITTHESFSERCLLNRARFKTITGILNMQINVYNVYVNDAYN